MTDDRAQAQQAVIGVKLFGRTLLLRGKAAWALALIVPGVVLAWVIDLAITKPQALKSALMSPLWISAALWVGMSVYWSKAAKQSAPVKTAESSSSRAQHQLLLNVALLLAFIPVPFLGARWLPVSPWVAPIGLAVQLGAIALDLWAMRCLGRNWSGKVAIKVDHELIRTGPYHLVRHPIYTAMIGMYLGTAIVGGELHGLLAVMLCAIAYWRKTRMEEHGLREAFGQAYEDYARVSYVLIPWVF